ITREDVTNYVESQRIGQPVGGQTVGGAAPATGATAAAAPGGNGSVAPAPTAPAAPAQTAPASGPAAAAPAATSGPRPAGPGSAIKAGPGIEFPAGADEVLVPLTQMRKGIAAQMTRALQAPHAYVQMEVDATRLVALREKAK